MMGIRDKDYRALLRRNSNACVNISNEELKELLNLAEERDAWESACKYAEGLLEKLESKCRELEGKLGTEEWKNRKCEEHIAELEKKLVEAEALAVSMRKLASEKNSECIDKEAELSRLRGELEICLKANEKLDSSFSNALCEKQELEDRLKGLRECGLGEVDKELDTLIVGAIEIDRDKASLFDHISRRREFLATISSLLQREIEGAYKAGAIYFGGYSKEEGEHIITPESKSYAQQRMKEVGGGR